MVLLRDTEYFNGQLYVFANEKITQLAKKHAKNNQMTLYMFVDKAIRKELKALGYEIPVEPKKPVLQ